MSAPADLALLLAQTPQEAGKLGRKPFASLPEKSKPHGQANSFRQSLRLESQRAKELPSHASNMKSFGCFHNEFSGPGPERTYAPGRKPTVKNPIGNATQG
jgi:hypothetical protein